MIIFLGDDIILDHVAGHRPRIVDNGIVPKLTISPIDCLIHARRLRMILGGHGQHVLVDLAGLLHCHVSRAARAFHYHLGVNKFPVFAARDAAHDTVVLCSLDVCHNHTTFFLAVAAVVTFLPRLHQYTARQ